MRSPFTRGSLLAAAVACATVVLSGCGAHAPARRGSPAARASPSAAGAPRVARGDGAPAHLADASGRWLSLHGVAVTGLVQYAADYDENPPLAPADAAEIAALGFNYVRLPVSWSLIEPAPGRFDSAYLDQIAQTVRVAGANGLDVVVDLHTDRYNRELAPGNEADGAPNWATVTPGAASPSACVTRFGSDACITKAWQSFWTDASLQRSYIATLVAISRRVRSATNVLGIELMNNPSPGDTPSPAFESDELDPFYARAVAALRADGEHRPLWLDDASTSEQTGAYAGPLARLSDLQLVFAPHDYTGIFSGPPWPSGGLASLAPWYPATEAVAQRLGTAAAIGEWGTGTGTESDVWIQTELGLQNLFRLGGAFWMWKQYPGFYGWSVVEPDGRLRTDTMRAQILSEPHPDATPGVLLSVAYKPGGALTVRVSGRGGDATLWSGAEVVHGGRSLLRAPLTRVRIDGHLARTTLVAREFSAAGVEVRGDVVSVSVPAGTHTITLS